MDPNQFWRQATITQISTGSVSLIASTVIVVFISLKGLVTPYRRLIFCLSVSDICQSISIVAGPFFNRSDSPQAVWGIGNKHTCRLDGFLFHVGTTAVPMYTLTLCIYYVYKLKDKMTDSQFTHRVEKMAHIIIIVINLGLHLSALAMDVINPSPLGNVCLAASVPTGCRQRPEIFGECDSTISDPAKFFSIINSGVIPVFCLAGIIYCLGSIFWHALMRDKIFGNHTTDDRREMKLETTVPRNKLMRSKSHRDEIFEKSTLVPAIHHEDRPSSESTKEKQREVCGDKIDLKDIAMASCTDGQKRKNCDQRLDIPQTASRNHKLNEDSGADGAGSPDPKALSRLYKKELLTQALCYVMIFCLSTMPYLIVNFLLFDGVQPSQNMVLVVHILYPLSGFFNIIIYTRWNVASFRRNHPQCSWLQAFWLVLKASGDLPSEDEWNATSLWRFKCCGFKSSSGDMFCSRFRQTSKKEDICQIEDIERQTPNSPPPGAPYQDSNSKFKLGVLSRNLVGLASSESSILDNHIENEVSIGSDEKSNGLDGHRNPPRISKKFGTFYSSFRITKASKNSSAPNSNLCMDGMSKSFDQENLCYRSQIDWDHIEGEMSFSRKANDGNHNQIRVVDTSTVEVPKRGDISFNLSSLTKSCN